MEIPTIASKVSVVVRNLSAVLRNPELCDLEPKTYTYVGKIIRGNDWVSKLSTPSFCIVLDDEPFPQRNPYRIVAMCNVVSINGVENDSKDDEVEEVEVNGSKGAKYLVMIKGTTITCNCPGYNFHGKCRHQELALQKLIEKETGKRQ